MKDIEEIIKATNEENESKIDWTKAWSKKYPVLGTYQNKVDIDKYSKKIRELFEIITSANCIPKGAQIRSYVSSFFKDRNIVELFNYVFAFLKCGLDVFFGK